MTDCANISALPVTVSVMKAHDTAETPPSVPRYRDRDDLERSVNGEDEQTHDHRQRSTVNQLAHTFLDNLKVSCCA
jgi:hypothetical protein